MIDLSKEKISVKCTCGRNHIVTLQDTIDQRTINCSCGTAIKLSDKTGSVKKGVADMNKAFKDLGNSFKKLGK